MQGKNHLLPDEEMAWPVCLANLPHQAKNTTGEGPCSNTAKATFVCLLVLLCFTEPNFFFFFKIKKKQRTIQMLTRRGKVGAVSPTLCLVAGSRSVSLHLNVLYWFPASVTWRFNLISLPWHASLICVSVKPWWIIQTCFLYSLLCSSLNTSLVQVSILTLPDWFP